ncbi:hypothetical protein ACTD5D_39955 [Nocardia takedensis]|uniref:hypothetical protein n=1 Tax=Nocardia takedensis TaxID=259390 RepID=UPI003F75974C
MIYDSTAAGIILDATALAELTSSFFLQTLVATHIEQDRRVIVPVLALSHAANSSRITYARIHHRGVTTIDFTAGMVDDVAVLAREATGLVAPDVLHCAFEAIQSGYPIVTGQPLAYAHIPHPLHLEPL